MGTTKSARKIENNLQLAAALMDEAFQALCDAETEINNEELDPEMHLPLIQSIKGAMTLAQHATIREYHQWRGYAQARQQRV